MSPNRKYRNTWIVTLLLLYGMAVAGTCIHQKTTPTSTTVESLGSILSRALKNERDSDTVHNLANLGLELDSVDAPKGALYDGVEIKLVTPGSPAARAQLHIGDHLMAINGHRLIDMHAISKLCRESKSAGVVRLIVSRGDRIWSVGLRTTL